MVAPREFMRKESTSSENDAGEGVLVTPAGLHTCTTPRGEKLNLIFSGDK
jgi:hypothetical protein